jgi:hypothetical protein
MVAAQTIKTWAPIKAEAWTSGWHHIALVLLWQLFIVRQYLLPLLPASSLNQLSPNHTLL